jgi:hypothetical protein
MAVGNVTLHDCTTTRSNALHGEPQHNRANSFGFTVVLPIDLSVSPASSKATLKKPGSLRIEGAIVHCVV